VQYREIQVGQEYGVRLRLAAGEPLIHVAVVDKVDRTKQVKVRHVDEPHAGMEEYVAFRHVVVSWKERRRFLSDEQKLAQVREMSAGVDFVTKEAVQFVLEATGENAFFVHSDGHLSADHEPLLRVAVRARLTPDPDALDPHAFVDRDGNVQMTFAGAEKLAMAVAAAEPDTVTMYVAEAEDVYEARGYDMGERFWHEHLRKQRPIYALARQWAGFETEVARLRQEIGRLRNLLSMAADDLRKAGLTREAGRLAREMDRK
jgi:hypothetical protein